MRGSIDIASIITLSLLAVARMPVAAQQPSAEGTFTVKLSPHRYAAELLPRFALRHQHRLRAGHGKDLEARLKAMQEAGSSGGGRTSPGIGSKKKSGRYEFEPHERLEAECRSTGSCSSGVWGMRPGSMIRGPRLALKPMRAFARKAAGRFSGKVDVWQIWNEPNGGFWQGKPEEYARCLALAGKAIHEAKSEGQGPRAQHGLSAMSSGRRNPEAGAYDCFDVACFHPYRPPSAPEGSSTGGSSTST